MLAWFRKFLRRPTVTGSNPTTPFLTGWHRFLQEVELSRNYPMPYRLNAFGAAARNPLLERILPSLLYIKLATLLDDALQTYISDRKLTVPSQYHDSFGGRINFLSEQGALSEPRQWRRIKDRRNELAHENDAQADWEELDNAISPAHDELRHLGFAGPRPRYEPFAERSAMRETSRPDALWECTHSFGLKRDDKVVVEIKWTSYTMKD